MNTTKITSSRWLRVDAAESYIRMVAAGMPIDGLAAAGRTFAEQTRLYKLYRAGKGNLAARPGTSLHESGLAADITCKARRTKQHIWMTVGGDEMHVRKGEKLRAHRYGWYRTVPSEPWHFQYFPSKDRSRTTRKPLDFRLTSLNVLGRRFDYGKTWDTRLPRVIARLNQVLEDGTNNRSSVYVLTECAAKEAAELAAALGMKSESYINTSILYNGTWTLGGRWEVKHASTHGTLIVELRRDGRTLNVVGSHLPPFVTRAGVRASITKALVARAKGWSDPTIWAGDFNSTSAVEKLVDAADLWQSARISATEKINANYRTNGGWKVGSPIDYVFAKRVTLRSYRVLRGWDPASKKPATDHNMITVQASLA